MTLASVSTERSGQSGPSDVRPRTPKRHLGRGLDVLLVSLITLIVSMLVAPPLLQALGGIRMIVVDGGSMAPTYHVGDVLIVRPPTSTDLREGAVLVVGTPPTSYTHRVVAIEDRDGTPWAQLRGDANATADPSWVTLAQVTAVPVAVVSGPAAIAIVAVTSLPGTLSLVALGMASAIFWIRPRSRAASA